MPSPAAPFKDPARSNGPAKRNSDATGGDAEQQWIYTAEELLASPSMVDGMTVQAEREARSKGVNFITQVGIMLKLPQTTLSTAAVYFNRFLMRVSLVEHKGREKALHHYQVAAIALFVATKVEEHVRKLKEVVVACCRVAQKNPNLVVDEQTKDYWRWRDTILLNEDVMLEMLCFDLTLDSPHKMLFDMLKAYGMAHNKSLRDAAWSILNDCGLTQICLLCPSRTIACAALYASAKICDVQLADDDRGRPWWTTQGVRLAELKVACNYLSDWYQKPPIKPTLSEEAYVSIRTPRDDDESNAKTRLRKGGKTSSGAQQPPSPMSTRGSTATSPGRAHYGEEMVRGGSQQSLGKRAREDDLPAEDVVPAEERYRVEKEQAASEKLNGHSRDPASTNSGRQDGGAGIANGSRRPGWEVAAQAAPVAKKPRLDDAGAGERPPDAAVSAMSLSTPDVSTQQTDDAKEEGELEG